MIDYNRYIVELQSSAPNGKNGSGVIYFPEGSEFVVILTAKHVLANSNIEDITIRNITRVDGTLIGISSENIRERGIIQSSREHDLAIIRLPISILKDISGVLRPLPSVDQHFDFKYCQSIGYPHANYGEIKLLKSEFRAINEQDDHLIEASTVNHENLITRYADAIDNVRGMSGGAFFYSDGTNIFFTGIISKFQNEYKDFVSIGLKAVNEFLSQEGIPQIPLTYGSRGGLDAKWFEKHIEQSCTALGPRYTQELPNFDVPQAEYFKYLAQGADLKEDVKNRLHDLLKSLNKNIWILQKEHSLHIYK